MDQAIKGNRRKPRARATGIIGLTIHLTVGGSMQGRIKIGMLAGLLAGSAAVQAAPHPDLSGTWSLPFEVHSSGFPLMGGTTPWLPASQGDPARFPIPTLQQLSDRVDDSVKNHQGNPTFALPPPIPAPLTQKGKEAAEKLDLKVEEKREINCYPSNVFHRVGGGFQTVQIVQGMQSVAIIADGNDPSRVVYLDGRSHDNVLPQWNGHSVGHWVGDSLQVETAKIRGEALQRGYPISEDARLLETFRLIKGGKVLEVNATFEDPTYYSEPLHKIMYLDRHPELQVTDYSCEEGKEDMIETALEKGKTP
jgi:hypothetical protein